MRYRKTLSALFRDCVAMDVSIIDRILYPTGRKTGLAWGLLKNARQQNYFVADVL